MSFFQGEGKRKKRRKKESFNRRDIMYGIINYNILIFNFIRRFEIIADNEKVLAKCGLSKTKFSMENGKKQKLFSFC